MRQNIAFTTARRHFLRGEFAQSIADFNTALEQGMNPECIHTPLGLAQLKHGDFADAVESFSCALALDQGNDRLYFLRGITYMNLDDPDTAVDDFDDAIELNDRRGASRVARYLALRSLGKDEEAREDMEAVLALGDVEVELFIREYCIAPAMQHWALELFDVGRGGKGWKLWRRHSTSTH